MPLVVKYDEARANAFLQELRASVVDIPENIMAQGFQVMAVTLARIEAYRSRALSIMAEIIPMKAAAASQLASAKFTYETQLDVLIDTDSEITALPSDKTKIARANKKLINERRDVMEATAIHKQFVALSAIVQNTIDGLEKKAEALTEISNMYKRTVPLPLTPGQQPRSVPGAY